MSEGNAFHKREAPSTSAETQENHPPHSNLVDLLHSTRETPLAPAANTLIVEPINAGISALNSASHSGANLLNKVFGSNMSAPEASSLQHVDLGDTKTGSANYYSQKIFAGVGAAVAVAASASLLGKANRELKVIETGVQEIQAGSALRSLAHDSHALSEASKLKTALRVTPPTPLKEIFEHTRSADSPIGLAFSEKEKTLFEQFADSHKLASLDGVAIKEKIIFDQPTRLNDELMQGAQVTSITTYENGVRVYENPTGIKHAERPDAYDHATRFTTDHQTFMKKEWGGKVSFIDGVGAGASVESVTELRDGAAAYVNEAGLFGSNSERVLLQNYDTRVRLFDKVDEVKALQSDAALDTHVQKIVDTFAGVRADSRIESLLAQVPAADRPIADAIMNASTPSIRGNALMQHFRSIGQEGQLWWKAHAPNDMMMLNQISPAADDSAQAFSYLAGKSRTQLGAGPSVLNMYPPEKQREALVLFGDTTKLSQAEIDKLKEFRASGVPIAIFDNTFDRGVNALDLTKGTAKEKLDTLIEAVKTKQAESDLTAEAATAAILREPGRKLAQEIDAKLLGENAQTWSAPDENLHSNVRTSLERAYKFGDDRSAAAKAIADLRFYDLPDMLDSFKTLHHFVDEAANSNALYVSHRGKSQSFVNYMYKEANDLDAAHFVDRGDVKKLSPAQLEGKTLGLLDDAAYSGAQADDNVESLLLATNYKNPVIVANLASYRKAYDRMRNIEGMQITSLESMMPFYKPGGLRTETAGSQNGVGGAKFKASSSEPFDPQSVESKRQDSFFEFNRGGTWGKLGNRVIFFYKQADSTPQFIQSFLREHFGITQ